MAKKCNLVSVVGVLLVILISQTPIIVNAGEGIPPVALFTFGDSSYDAGNKVFLIKSNEFPPQTLWPYGKSRDDPNGKFSDGYIIPDFISGFMNIPNTIPPVLKPGANISRGASFAVADATIRGTPTESMQSHVGVFLAFEKDASWCELRGVRLEMCASCWLCLTYNIQLSLNQQVEQFKIAKGNWSDDYINRSLFMIYIGTDDYLKFIKTSPTPGIQLSFTSEVITQLRTDIQSLYELGARKFVLQLLAPLGCLPIVRQDHNTGFIHCYEPLNEAAKLHNKHIGPMLNDLAKANTGFQFTVFDFYNAVIRRTLRKNNYRFYETNISCCGVGTHNAYGCGKGNVHSKLCEYQRSYFFFDGRHNSEKGQEEMAHLLYGADPNVVQPMTVRELIVYPNGENMREYWEANKTSVSVQRRPSLESYSGFPVYDL